jgi:hypothetical protein
MQVGADDGDGRDVAEIVVLCFVISALSSHRPSESSSAMVGSRTACSSLNPKHFLGGGGAVPNGAAEVSGVL